MSDQRLSGAEFWPDAKRMIEDFPAAAKALATEKADENGLKGIRRGLSILANTMRINTMRDQFKYAAVIRGGFGSRETAKELLEVFAYPKSKVGMRYQVYSS